MTLFFVFALDGLIFMFWVTFYAQITGRCTSRFKIGVNILGGRRLRSGKPLRMEMQFRASGTGASGILPNLRDSQFKNVVLRN